MTLPPSSTGGLADDGSAVRAHTEPIAFPFVRSMLLTRGLFGLAFMIFAFFAGGWFLSEVLFGFSRSVNIHQADDRWAFGFFLLLSIVFLILIAVGLIFSISQLLRVRSQKPFIVVSDTGVLYDYVLLPSVFVPVEYLRKAEIRSVAISVNQVLVLHLKEGVDQRKFSDTYYYLGVLDRALGFVRPNTIVLKVLEADATPHAIAHAINGILDPEAGRPPNFRGRRVVSKTDPAAT